MKIIQANGITNINELKNSGGWYWGTGKFCIRGWMQIVFQPLEGKS